MPYSIRRYENAIQNSHSKPYFAILSDLNIIPSDLVMNIGSLKHSNNNILIAVNDMNFGQIILIINYYYHQ